MTAYPCDHARGATDDAVLRALTDRRRDPPVPCLAAARSAFSVLFYIIQHDASSTLTNSIPVPVGTPHVG
jgi:hypothetical protein